MNRITAQDARLFHVKRSAPLSTDEKLHRSRSSRICGVGDLAGSCGHDFPQSYPQRCPLLYPLPCPLHQGSPKSPFFTTGAPPGPPLHSVASSKGATEEPSRTHTSLGLDDVGATNPRYEPGARCYLRVHSIAGTQVEPTGVRVEMIRMIQIVLRGGAHRGPPGPSRSFP